MLLFLSFPAILPKKNSNFCTGWFRTTPKYILTKFRDAKIDIFDVIEKNVILRVLEVSAFGTKLMTVSILYPFLYVAFATSVR